MLGLTGIPAAIELILLPFFPESPRYMLIQRGDEKTARKGKGTQKHSTVDSEDVGEPRMTRCGVVCPPCSSAAAAWLGQRGGGADGDASGGAVGARRGTPVCAQPAVPALPPLAAGLRHRHEHGPAAVGGQRCESSLSLYFSSSLSFLTQVNQSFMYSFQFSISTFLIQFLLRQAMY